MPIVIINKHSGQQIMVKGESDAAMFERQRSGLIPIEWPDGHLGHVQKDAIWATKVVPLEEHNKRVEEEQKKRLDEEAARLVAQEDAAKARLDAQAKQAANAAWRSKFFLARLFTKKPHPEIG